MRLKAQRLHPRASPGEAADVVRSVCGVNAQLKPAMMLSLRARIRGAEPGDLTDLIDVQRALVRTWAMRGTMHLLFRGDAGLILPLVGHNGVLLTPFTQRVNGLNEVTQADPSLAPEGMHLTMSHQTMLTGDVREEIRLGLQDLKAMFAGKKYSVLMVQSYRDDWPVNRVASGYDLGNLTPVKGLFVVGDGAKGHGGIEVEGVALGVQNALDLIKKAYS